MLTVAAKIVFNKLPELRGELRQRASQVVRKTAFDIEGQAKAVVPVDTGNLKNSIQTTMEGDLTGVISTAVEYAVYVEYGTSKMGARPYMTPAAEQVRGPFTQAIEQLLK